MKPKLSLKGRGLQLLAQREHSRVELRRKLMRYARAQCEAVDARAHTTVGRPVSAVPGRTQDGFSLEAEAEAEAHEGEGGGGSDRRDVTGMSQRLSSADALRLPGQIGTLRGTPKVMLPQAETSKPGCGDVNGSCSRSPSSSPVGDSDHGAGPSTPTELVESVLDWLQARGYLNEERFVESRIHARAARFGNQRIRQELALHGVALGPEELKALKDSELVRARSVWSRKFAHHPIDAAERARQMRFLAGRGFSSDVVRRVVQGGDDD